MIHAHYQKQTPSIYIRIPPPQLPLPLLVRTRVQKLPKLLQPRSLLFVRGLGGVFLEFLAAVRNVGFHLLSPEEAAVHELRRTVSTRPPSM